MGTPEEDHALLTLGVRRRSWPAGPDRAWHHAVTAAVLAREAAGPGLQVSNVGGWHSAADLMLWPEPPVASLVARLADAVAEACGEGWTCQMWATVMRAGAYHRAHRHGTADWSGVYYVAPGDPGCGGQITFARLDTSARLEPAEGVLLLFPGDLLHSVEVYRGAGPRVSVALNLARLAQ